MTAPYERVKTAWCMTDRRRELNDVVEVMAAEGVTLDALDTALERLLLEVRAAGADDATEEIIMEVGDRLHGWCHPDGQIKTQTHTPSTEAPGGPELAKTA